MQIPNARKVTIYKDIYFGITGYEADKDLSK